MDGASWHPRRRFADIVKLEIFSTTSNLAWLAALNSLFVNTWRLSAGGVQFMVLGKL